MPEIVVRNIPNPDVRYAALKAGEILGVLDINAIPPFLAEEIKQDDRFAISTNKSTMIRFLALNGSRFPFNDVRMRQAVSLAIDRKDLVQALYLNYAEPTANLLNYTSPYYKDYPVEYDPEKARKLAREVLGGQRCEVVYCINGGRTAAERRSRTDLILAANHWPRCDDPIAGICHHGPADAPRRL